MSEAKNTTTEKHQEPWAGPRAVLQRVAYAANAANVAAAHESALVSDLDGVEWVLPDRLDTLAESLTTISTALARLRDPRWSVAACIHTTDIEATVQELIPVLEACASHSVTALSLTLPPIAGAPGPGENADATPGFARYQDQLNFAFQVLYRLRFTAERSGVAIALEPGSGGGLLSPVELREIINEANSASVGACIDVDRIALIGSPADWIETLRHRVHLVRFGRVAPTGDMLTALRRAGYDRTAVVEDSTMGPAIREALAAPT